MVTLAQAARALAHLPNLLLSQVLALVYLSMHVKKKILLLYPSIHPPAATPPDLPLETRTFLARSCSLTDRDVEACWDTVQDLVWQEVLRTFLSYQTHGIISLSFSFIFPCISIKRALV